MTNKTNMTDITNMTDSHLSRRAFLSTTGALVVSLAAAGEWSEAAANTLPTRPPLTGDQISSYITIEPDGSVIAYYGKIDGGQGLGTSIAQMVAEEIDVAFERVKVVMGDSGLTLDMGGASAAIGVSHGGMMLRRTAAETRRLLVEMASHKLSLPTEALTVTDGVVHAKVDATKRVSYAELIGGRYLDNKVKWNGRLSNGLQVEVEAPLKKHTEFKVIGKSLPRRDLPGKVFGTLEMVNDVRLPGMLHARMIRPPVAGAVPVKVDEDSIKHIPGAKAVHIKDLLAVVAEKEWNAVKAARALKVTWSESKPSFPGHDKLHEHIRKAPIVKREFQRENGNFEDGIKQAVRVIEGEYEFPTQSHSSTGPACAVADVRDGGATIWTSTQKPYDSAYCVAELIGLPKEKVHAVLSPYDGLSIGILSSLKGVGYCTAAQPCPIVSGQDAEIPSVKSMLKGEQYSTVFKDTRDLARVTANLVDAVLAGKQPEINDTKTYNNGVKVVPSYLLKPVAVDASNWKKVLIDSGYYKESQVK